MFVPFTAQISAATAAGLLAHWGYFVHGECDLQAANIARVHILAAAVLPYLKCEIEDLSARQAASPNWSMCERTRISLTRIARCCMN